MLFYLFLFFLYVVDLLTIDRYDVTGVSADRIQRILQSDWAHLVNDQKVLESPNYLKEKGKPVIALWGKILFFSPAFPGTSLKKPFFFFSRLWI